MSALRRFASGLSVGGVLCPSSSRSFAPRLYIQDFCHSIPLADHPMSLAALGRRFTTDCPAALPPVSSSCSSIYAAVSAISDWPPSSSAAEGRLAAIGNISGACCVRDCASDRAWLAIDIALAAASAIVAEARAYCPATALCRAVPSIALAFALAFAAEGARLGPTDGLSQCKCATLASSACGLGSSTGGFNQCIFIIGAGRKLAANGKIERAD